MLVAGVRQAINNQEHTKDERFDAVVDLVHRYDAGDLKPLSIAARQRALLVNQIRQIRSLLKSLVGLDLQADDASQWGCLPKRAKSNGFLWITHFAPAASV